VVNKFLGTPVTACLAGPHVHADPRQQHNLTRENSKQVTERYSNLGIAARRRGSSTKAVQTTCASLTSLGISCSRDKPAALTRLLTIVAAPFFF
jgi:hypothetical protein